MPEHRSLLEAVATSLRQDQCTSNRFIVPDWVAGIADQLCFAAAFVQQAKCLPQTAATSQGQHMIIALPFLVGWQTLLTDHALLLLLLTNFDRSLP